MNHHEEAKALLKRILQRKAVREACEKVGGIGSSSKMPGVSYGISAYKCGVGRKLAVQRGTVCSGCYAMKDNYTYPSVVRAHEARLESLKDIKAWRRNMIHALGLIGSMLPDEQRYMRWHDSGDLQGMEHLDAILTVARNLPEWHFWLPTKEYDLVRNMLAWRTVPKNLTVRVSMPVIGQAPYGIWRTKRWLTSTVGWNKGFQCPALNQESQCRDCRKCWERTEANVNYTKH